MSDGYRFFLYRIQLDSVFVTKMNNETESIQYSLRLIIKLVVFSTNYNFSFNFKIIYLNFVGHKKNSIHSPDYSYS